MNTQSLSIAVRVIQTADRIHPADAVLRLELKNTKGLSRAESKEISEAVFAYYRWFGWLEKTTSVQEQIERAIELDADFQKNPSSIPDAELLRAVQKWVAESMTISPEWLRSLQMKPALWLRARPGHGKELGQRLDDCHPANKELPDTLRYQGEHDLFRTTEFHAGEFELQDISSQMVGLICNPKPGETWWDACAGEGGKALHLCDLMQNKGLLWASDRVEWRLKKLKLRAARAKIFNYRLAVWDGGPTLPTKAKFDGILVDAPCSGVGTWGRNPQARWTTTLEDVHELGRVQERLLANVVSSLKPGGKLIYSVCTLTTWETIGVADATTRQFPNLKPLEFSIPGRSRNPPTSHLFLWPMEMSGNGMFICAWENRK